MNARIPFDQVMSVEKSNPLVYQSLLFNMQQDGVIPVIGAGLSAWVYPTWDAVLRKLFEDSVIHDKETVHKIQEHLSLYEFEEAALMLKEVLGEKVYFNKLQDIFDVKKIDTYKTYRPKYQQYLPILFRGPVATTNFDCCLEELFGFKGERILCPKASFESRDKEKNFAINLRDSEKMLVKLHGSIRYPTGMVFDSKQYDEVYGVGSKNGKIDFSKPVPIALRALFYSKRLLFLGCGLKKDRTCTVLQSCFCEGYAIMEKNDVSDFAIRKRELQDMNVSVIWYQKGQHYASLSSVIFQLYYDLRRLRTTYKTGIHFSLRPCSESQSIRVRFHSEESKQEFIDSMSVELPLMLRQPYAEESREGDYEVTLPVILDTDHSTNQERVRELFEFIRRMDCEMML